MAAAWATVPLEHANSIGWRCTIENKRGKYSRSGVVDVKVCGTWFRLDDTTKIKPIAQEEESEGEEDDGEEGDGEEGDSEEDRR